MTVITAVISKHCCAHATDSFITDFHGKILKDQDPKLIYIEKFRGALAFWGAALFLLGSVQNKIYIYDFTAKTTG